MTLRDDYHLTALIGKFYRIGKQKYNGKVYDNVLNIFEELDIEEQKALLRGALGVYVAATTNISHERDVIDHGDVDALLGHLRKLKEAEAKNLGVTLPPEEERPPRKDKNVDDSDLTRKGISAIFLIVLGIIIFTTMDLITLALDSNPETIARAKIYRTVYEIIAVLFGSK